MIRLWAGILVFMGLCVFVPRAEAVPTIKVYFDLDEVVVEKVGNPQGIPGTRIIQNLSTDPTALLNLYVSRYFEEFVLYLLSLGNVEIHIYSNSARARIEHILRQIRIGDGSLLEKVSGIHDRADARKRIHEGDYPDEYLAEYGDYFQNQDGSFKPLGPVDALGNSLLLDDLERNATPGQEKCMWKMPTGRSQEFERTHVDAITSENFGAQLSHYLTWAKFAIVADLFHDAYEEWKKAPERPFRDLVFQRVYEQDEKAKKVTLKYFRPDQKTGEAAARGVTLLSKFNSEIPKWHPFGAWPEDCPRIASSPTPRK